MAGHDREILRLLPLEGGGPGISTPEVRDALARLGIHHAHVESVQRMLTKLEEMGSVEGVRCGRALYWHQRQGARGLGHATVATMSFDDALALQTLHRFSARQLPGFASQSLSPMLEVAERRLAMPNNDLERRYANWGRKVSIEPGVFSFQGPAVDVGIFSTVTRALFLERRLRVAYRPRSNPGDGAWRELLPLGLVEVAGIIYLVARIESKPAPAMYRLSRMTGAEIALESFDYPADFTLDAYVKEQRQFDFFVEGAISIALRFANSRGNQLLESPLCENQVHRVVGGHLEVCGTVLLSKRLRWWLRSFGPDVEVLEPAALRAEIAAEATALARLYGPANAKSVTNHARRAGIGT